MSEDVESFFFREEKSGTELFREYLESKPDNLYNALKRIVPKDLHQKLGLGTWGWISGLFDKEEGVLLKAEEEVKSDVESLFSAHQSVKNLFNLLRANYHLC